MLHTFALLVSLAAAAETGTAEGGDFRLQATGPLIIAGSASDGASAINAAAAPFAGLAESADFALRGGAIPGPTPTSTSTDPLLFADGFEPSR